MCKADLVQRLAIEKNLGAKTDPKAGQKAESSLGGGFQNLKNEVISAIGLEGKTLPDLKETVSKAVKAGTKLIRTYPLHAILVGLGIGLIAGLAARGSRSA